MERYGNRDEKLNKNQLKQIAREAANRAAFDRIVEVMGMPAVRKLTFKALSLKITAEFNDPSQEPYSESNLKNYRYEWQKKPD